jgi:hypothetical protein
MATNVTFNGVTYTLPQTGDTDYGAQLAAFLRSVATNATTAAGSQTLTNKTLDRPVINAARLSNNTGETVSASGEAKLRLNGSLVQVSGNAGRWQTIGRDETKIYNVLDYGADPTGVADSYTAIQNAINAAISSNVGRTVYLPAGTYRITQTLFINNTRPFKFLGDGELNTLIQWDGTPTYARWMPSYPAWAASTYYSYNDRVTLGGNTYECITSGTSAGSGGPTGTGSNITDGSAHWKYLRATAYSLNEKVIMSGAVYNCSQAGTPASNANNRGPILGYKSLSTGIVDGTCHWDFVDYDFSSDILRVQNSQYVEVAYMELRGATGTKRPRACINIQVVPSIRAYAPSGHKFHHLWLGGVGAASGLPNQCDAGVQFGYLGSELNNSEMSFAHINVTGAIAAFVLDGSQVKCVDFHKCNTSTVDFALYQGQGGAFTSRDCNWNASARTGTCIYLNQPDDYILVTGMTAETTGRLLDGGNYGSSAWIINFTNCRFSCDNIADDGVVVNHKWAAHSIIEKCMFDGGCVVGAGRADRSSSSEPRATTSRFRSGTTASPSRPTTAYYPADASIIHSTFYTRAVIESGNAYYTGGSPTTKYRFEAGSLTFDNSGASQTHTYEVPVHAASDTYGPFISANIVTRTGASVASVTISTITRTTAGFTITLSGAPTGTDTCVVHWEMKWP